MAMLYLTTAFDKGKAAPGNKEPVSVVLSITDVNGKLVAPLNTVVVTVDTLVMSVFGLVVKNIRNAASRHVIQLVPVQDNPWQSGAGTPSWVVGIDVVRGADQGHTVVGFTLDL